MGCGFHFTAGEAAAISDVDKWQCHEKEPEPVRRVSSDEENLKLGSSVGFFPTKFIVCSLLENVTRQGCVSAHARCCTCPRVHGFVLFVLCLTLISLFFRESALLGWLTDPRLPRDGLREGARGSEASSSVGWELTSGHIF